MSEHWSNGNNEPRPGQTADGSVGRWDEEISQGLRCRHERRWEDGCRTCGRSGRDSLGLELLRLSDELETEREARRVGRIGVGELHQWFDFAKDIIRSCAQSRDYENAPDCGAADEWWEHQRRCREFMLKIEEAP